MIKLLIALAVLFLAVCLFFLYLSMSTKKPELGIVNNHLLPCPESPNCVSTEAGTDRAHFVEPIAFTQLPEDVEQLLLGVLTGMGGHVVEQKQDYIHAEFTSRIFRFVDDVEIRIDEKHKAVHIRSASRVGYSDFGVNTKRVQQIKRRLSTVFQVGQ